MTDPLDEIRTLTGAGMRSLAQGGSRRPVGAREESQGQGLWPLLVMLGVICLLWSTPLVYPLRLLVVFFHELSHALMALASGGTVLRIELSPLEGGLAVTSGGSRFLIASAGYLGSLLWGGAVLWIATQLRSGRSLTGALAVVLLLVCLCWVRPLLSFGMLFCLLAGAGLLWVALRLSHVVNGLLLRLIGLTSLLYAPLDILDDTVLRHGHPSDARQLAELTGIPALLWGVGWCGLSVLLALWFIAQAGRRSRRDSR